MTGKGSRSVLYAIADWGLGHATRSAPIIEWLAEEGVSVSLASAGRAGEWLKDRFPNLPFLALPSYGIRYPTGVPEVNMIWSSPKLLQAIRQEKKQIRKWVASDRFDFLISDNRFGAFTPAHPTIYITHQLRVPRGSWPYAHVLATHWHHQMIKQSSECWVPDWEGEPNLSGALSHPVPTNLSNVFFIGPLSGMSVRRGNKVIPVVAVLSGPEPQRSRLEMELINQLQERSTPSLIIRGCTDEPKSSRMINKLRIANWMDAEELSRAVAGAELLIMRPGYSGLMDLYAFSKPCLLIPTPGQPEQAYLARHWEKTAGVLVQQQGQIRLKEAIRALKGSRMDLPLRSALEPKTPLWQERLKVWLNR